MKRAGEVFAGWHADDSRRAILTELHGLNTHPDLGDYLAYYAPAEKSFVTSRYRLHRTELKDLVTVRRVVLDGKRPDEDALIRPGDLRPMADKYAISHLSIGQVFVPLPPRAVLYARVGLGGSPAAVQQFTDALWHVDGRLGVIGRQDTADTARRTTAMGWEAGAFV